MTTATLLGTPERTDQQRLAALIEANRIRTYRARLKRDVKAGRRQVAPLIADPPEELATMKVFDLLLAMPKYGRVKVNRIIVALAISPSKTVGGLSERQRRLLVAVMGGERPADAAERLAREGRARG